jgi:hypothetical protein
LFAARHTGKRKRLGSGNDERFVAITPSALRASAFARWECQSGLQGPAIGTSIAIGVWGDRRRVIEGVIEADGMGDRIPDGMGDGSDRGVIEGVIEAFISGPLDVLDTL